MPLEKHQIVVSGKLYGYWVSNGEIIDNIRSETNPWVTPYLKIGSTQWLKVRAAIENATGEAK